jgi:hypothetical protein
MVMISEGIDKRDASGNVIDPATKGNSTVRNSGITS